MFSKKPKKSTDFFTVEEIAEMLQLSKSKVYQLVESCKIIPHRIGGSIRVSESDLNLYLESCRREKQPSTKKPSRIRLKHIKL